MERIRGIFTRYGKYASNTGLYLLASLIPAVLSVLINPLLAMNLSPEDYAIIAYYTSFGGLFGPIIGFFIMDYYLKCYYASTKDELEKLKGTALMLLLLVSAPVSLLCLLGLFIYSFLAHVTFSFLPYALYAILQLYFSYFYSFQLAEYKIKGDGKSFFRVSVFWGIVVVLLNLLLVVFIKGGASGKLLAAMIGSMLPCLVYLFKNRAYIKLKIDFKLAFKFFTFGYPLVLAGLLEFFSHGYDKVLLERQGDITAMGYYAVACQMSGYLNLFATALKSTFQPDIYEAISERNIKKVVLIIMMVIGIISFVVFVYILVCPQLISLLTAGRYTESSGLSRITSLSVISASLYYLISLFTYGVGLTKLTLINKIMGTVINIVILTIMIRTYGTTGAAWGTVFSFIVYAIGNVLLLYVNRGKFIGEEK